MAFISHISFSSSPYSTTYLLPVVVKSPIHSTLPCQADADDRLAFLSYPILCFHPISFTQPNHRHQSPQGKKKQVSKPEIKASVSAQTLISTFHSSKFFVVMAVSQYLSPLISLFFPFLLSIRRPLPREAVMWIIVIVVVVGMIVMYSISRSMETRGDRRTLCSLHLELASQRAEFILLEKASVSLVPIQFSCNW